jgi:imidazolonepropionase-like amidohydrolase
MVLNPVNRLGPTDIDEFELGCSTFDDGAAAKLAERLSANGTWPVPTLIRSRTSYTCDQPEFRADSNLRFVAQSELERWERANNAYAQFPGPARQTFKLVYATLLKLAKLLDEAGVPMMAGSDACGSAWEVPGASLHSEFDALARAGFSPLRMLQMTTSDPADFLGSADSLGSVSAGRYADMVLLDADPLASVEHLHRVSAVVSAGRLYDSADLARLKEEVASDTPVR